MNIFVFEYVTGGGMLDCEPPRSLINEGDMMLRALVADLAELESVAVTIMRDSRLPEFDLPVTTRVTRNSAEFDSIWQDCVRTADAVWPIAPECGGVLAEISASIVANNRILLGSRPDAVRLTTSKLATSNHLQALGVPVIPSYNPRSVLPDHPGQWVLKPDDGAGCLDTRICRDRNELYREFSQCPDTREYVAQPFVQGTPASICVLARNGAARVLSTNRQRVVVMNNGFVLLGCVVNGVLVGSQRVRRLAQTITAGIPGLWGVLGIDLIVTENHLRVIEINPRLTTSYVGLRASTGVNPAASVIAMLDKDAELPEAISTGYRAIDVDIEYLGAA